MNCMHPVYGTFSQSYRLTAMLRKIVEEANKTINLVVYKQKGGWRMLIFKIKVKSQE